MKKISMIFSLALYALSLAPNASAVSGTVKSLKFEPSGAGGILALEYSGSAKFLLTEDNTASQIILQAEGLELPSRLTRTIDVSASGAPILQITPYNSGGRSPQAKIVLQLKSKASVHKTEFPGKVWLEIKDAGATQEYVTKQKAPWKFPGYSEGKSNARDMSPRLLVEKDGLRFSSSANDKASEKSEEEARLLVENISSTEEKKNYKGARVSIEASDVDIHDVFRLIGEASNLNIITTDKVTSKVSVSMKDVPWDQLLDVLIRNNQLHVDVQGNVVRVTTLKEFNLEQEDKIIALEVAANIEPVVMAVIPLSYAKVADMQKMIDALIYKPKDSVTLGGSGSEVPPSGTAAGTGGTGSTGTYNARSTASNGDLAQAFMRGKIQTDERSNSLIVTNTKDVIDRIKKLVKELDVPLPQVLIDAKIVIASEQFSKTIGAQFGSGASPGDTQGVFGNFNGGGVTLGKNPLPSISLSSPTNTGLFGLAIGHGDFAKLNLTLSLNEINGTSKTIGSPRIIVNNKQTATIADGQRIANVTPGTANNPATTTYTDAVLKLTVTPQVTSAGSVVTDITINKDAPSASGGANIETKSIQTQVLVDSGSTLVLGGVYQFTSLQSSTGIPLLKDLPFIGSLFRTDTESTIKNELMVFITPQILEVGASANEVKLQ